MTITANLAPDMPTAEITTISDLLDHLAVPSDRVWSNPFPGMATEADMLHVNDHLDRLCELVDGTLVEKAMGNNESMVGYYLGSLLIAFIAPRKLGIILGADSMFRLFPGRVRMPDVAFVSADQIPNGPPPQPVWGFSPRLAIEVLSASNTVGEMRRKRSEYFSHGVELVWLVDLVDRTVTVYTAAETFTVLAATDRLTGGHVLPGFDVAVADVFSPLSV